MTTATSISPPGTFAPADTVTLDYDSRFRRRVMLTCDSGRKVLLDLPEAALLKDGDGLICDDGSVIEVKAAPERLLEIRSPDAHHLLRVAWHLGNRHLPSELGEGVIRIRHDHVIADMAQKLGAEVREVMAPFNPEGGAYGHGRTHSHGHGHGHSHDHDHHHHDR